MFWKCLDRNHRLALTVVAVVGLSSASFAQVTGTVKLDGKAPEMAVINMGGVQECANMHADPVYEEIVVTGDGGGLANVVVSIKADDPAALGGKMSGDTIVLSQKGCQYFPHVLAVMVGQKMSVKNEDATLHNVHALAQQNPAFNFPQPTKGEKPIDAMKTAEKFKVKCDVHPWMSAYVAVFEHPFFAVTDDKGAFSIPAGLPDGDYTVEAWHESLTAQTGTVSVKGGKGTVSFTFKPEGAMGPMPEMDHTTMVSTKDSADVKASCCSTGSVKADSVTMVKFVKDVTGKIELKAEH
jgi:plastocyanin